MEQPLQLISAAGKAVVSLRDKPRIRTLLGSFTGNWQGESGSQRSQEAKLVLQIENESELKGHFSFSILDDRGKGSQHESDGNITFIYDLEQRQSTVLDLDSRIVEIFYLEKIDQIAVNVYKKQGTTFKFSGSSLLERD